MTPFAAVAAVREECFAAGAGILFADEDVFRRYAQCAQHVHVEADVVRQRAAICLHLQVRARVKGQGADLCDDIFPDLERRLVDAGADPCLDRTRIEAFLLDQPRDGMMRDLLDRPGPSGVDGSDDAAVGIVQ